MTTEIQKLANECNITVQSLNAFLRKNGVAKIKSSRGKDVYELTPEVVNMVKDYYIKTPQDVIKEESLKKRVKKQEKDIARLRTSNQELQNMVRDILKRLPPEYRSHALKNARNVANDEFYTLYEDVSKELEHYYSFLKGKVVYCNCDNPLISNIFKYLLINFNNIALKQLYATNYATFGTIPYLAKIDHVSDELTIENVDSYIQYLKQNGDIQTLVGDGDFRSLECINLLRDSDVIITNPPFSLISELLDLLYTNQKHFILLGSKSLITYPVNSSHILDGSLRIGFTRPTEFYTDIKMTNKTGKLKNLVYWFTTFPINPPRKKLNLKTYDEENYSVIENATEHIIECSRVKDIPEYPYKLAVPITVLEYDLGNFEILGFDRDFMVNGKRFECNGKPLYSRLVIQRKEL